jgi:hypothetical protein
MAFPIKERLLTTAGFFGLTPKDVQDCANALAAEATRTGERTVSMHALEAAVGKDKAARFRNAVHLSKGIAAD